jgi:hypothetical protein
MARQPDPSNAAKSSPQPRRAPRESIQEIKKTSLGDLFWDILTFDRLMTGPVIHIIYWAGLLILVLGAFAAIGAAVGAAWHEEGINKVLLAAPMIVAGILFLIAGTLIWRAFCEFYVAVFRISDDLRAMRAQMERGVPLTEAVSAPKAAEPAPRAAKR